MNPQFRATSKLAFLLRRARISLLVSTVKNNALLAIGTTPPVGNEPPALSITGADLGHSAKLCIIGSRVAASLGSEIRIYNLIPPSRRGAATVLRPGSGMSSPALDIRQLLAHPAGLLALDGATQTVYVVREDSFERFIEVRLESEQEVDITGLLLSSRGAEVVTGRRKHAVEGRSPGFVLVVQGGQLVPGPWNNPNPPVIGFQRIWLSDPTHGSVSILDPGAATALETFRFPGPITAIRAFQNVLVAGIASGARRSDSSFGSGLMMFDLTSGAFLAGLDFGEQFGDIADLAIVPDTERLVLENGSGELAPPQTVG